MTKESCLKKSYESIFTSQGYDKKVNKDMDEMWVIPAMDEYAKVNAIEFKDWCDSNYYSLDGSIATENMDSQEAYQLFLQSKLNK